MGPYLLNDPDNRLVEVPSSFGVGTADGLARLYGILANGEELNGKTIMSIGKSFGHSGAGGQECWANPELKLGYGFVTNTPTLSIIETGKRYLLLRKSVYDCVQNLVVKGLLSNSRVLGYIRLTAYIVYYREHYLSGIEPSQGGSAFVVYHKGKKVVDIWGGYADKQSHRPWKQDTLANVYSTGKGVAAICIGMLVDRGLLSYDEKVVKYWPEFGKHGKENVTVKMLVSHQAAIPFPNETLTWDIFRDHEKLAGVLADSVPQWEIGTGHGYHTMTMASFCSVLVYKVDPKHRTLGQFVHDELYVPFGIDIHFGLPKELFHRVARMEEPKYTASQWVELVQNPLLRAFFLGSLRGEESIWNKVIRNMGELSDVS
ncbi:beta-lactamase domain-containing protein 2-like [Anneissia japonica]|uniref:beta-lactamase domain-containing protein 2-like n=1 Tax=Anneissia japonica TaxID=1529436 RepID=UPI0014257B4E|nr:beta-lactamase domain-containing protein 2-like [Anneissia japonica]